MSLPNSSCFWVCLSSHSGRGPRAATAVLLKLQSAAAAAGHMVMCQQQYGLVQVWLSSDKEAAEDAGKRASTHNMLLAAAVILLFGIWQLSYSYCVLLL